MKTITATKLREQLFPSLKSAALGDSLVVNTKLGPVLITAAPQKTKGSGGARIAGRIVRSLEGSDEELRDHLVWPR